MKKKRMILNWKKNLIDFGFSHGVDCHRLVCGGLWMKGPCGLLAVTMQIKRAQINYKFPLFSFHNTFFTAWVQNQDTVRGWGQAM